MFEEFNATLDKLKKQDFEDVLSFKRACNFVEEKALHITPWAKLNKEN